MKTLRTYQTVAVLIVGMLTALAQQQPAPSKTSPAAVSPNAPKTDAPKSDAVKPEAQETPAPPADKPAAKAETTAANAAPTAASDQGIRMNFKGAPLDSVLKYLSEAAGFHFLLDPDLGGKVEGRVDIFASQPMTKEQAIKMLNTVLNKNGYATVQKEDIYEIVKIEEARKKDIPVEKGAEPDKIPKNDIIVTQIIPVRYADAAAMTRDLQQLIPAYATLTANVSGNALVLTDTQANIRRMVEIVKALDTSIASISQVKVFSLHFADAKDLATVIKDLFEPSATTGNQRGGRGGGAGGGLQQLFGFGGRGGGPGGLFGGGGPGGGGGLGGGGAPQGGGGPSEARQAASRVVAVADERTNSLVVSAPDEYMPTIEKLVEQVDKAVDDVTELKVFHLKNSNPTEMADLLTELFPDTTSSRNQGNNRGGFGNPFGSPFGGGGPFGGGRGGGRGNQAQASDRSLKMGKVTAVADERTGSLVVSASHELLVQQIAPMIESLDANAGRKQKVFVYPLRNADPQVVQEALSMFEGQNSRNLNQRNNQQNNQLMNRNQQGNQGNQNSSFGNNAFGGSGNRSGR